LGLTMDKEYLKKVIEKEVRRIPREFRADRVVKGIIQCVLYQICTSEGLQPVPNYSHPKFRDTSVDLIAVGKDLSVVYSFAIDQTVTLQAVKGLKFFEDSQRYFITFSRLKKKVEESKFFLEPGIEHLDITW